MQKCEEKTNDGIVEPFSKFFDSSRLFSFTFLYSQKKEISAKREKGERVKFYTKLRSVRF